MPEPTPTPRRRIDTHGHLLPGIDDGSRNVAESLAIARAMSDAGYGTLACTPHIWPSSPFTAEFIAGRVAQLQAALDAEGIDVRLIRGGEINLANYDVDRVDEIVSYNQLGRHVLFDFWDDELPRTYWPRIESLQRRGLVCIQAHPERIEAFQHRPTLLDELAARGVLLQCNLQCLGDREGSLTRTLSERWLGEGRYFMFGSDVHRIETWPLRLRGLHRAIELLGDAEVDRLTIDNPAALL